MAVPLTVASFLVAFPEFQKADSGMLAAQLALAELDVSDSFDEQRELAVYLRLADSLALSPFGRNARMVAPNAATSTYGQRFQSMAEGNAVSPSRLGSNALSGMLSPAYAFYWLSRFGPFTGTPGGDE